MAYVFAHLSYDMDRFDLYPSYTEASGYPFVGLPFQLNGYQYGMEFHYWDLDYDRTLSFAGSNLTFDPELGLVPVSGTVSGLLEVRVMGEDWGFAAGIQGVSVSVDTLRDASLTPSTSDDQAILRAELAGADRFELSSQADHARGFGGDDVMRGNRGDDHLLGGAGADLIFGGAGSDVLHAETGHDVLGGGMGQDKLYGGTDSLGDDFRFSSASQSAIGSAHDVIFNFSRGADDIDLSRIDANAGTPGSNQAFSFSNGMAASHSIWWSDWGTGTSVRGDVTGDARADFEIFVTGVNSLSESDFIL